MPRHVWPRLKRLLNRKWTRASIRLGMVTLLRNDHPIQLHGIYPGKPIFLSLDGNENYYKNALILLVRTNCVVIFIAIKRKKNMFPRIRMSRRVWPRWGTPCVSPVTLEVDVIAKAHPTPYTLHPAPYTLHPIPYPLPPTPYPLLPSPYILHPTPYTLHPTPFTLHPAPFTLHPARRPYQRESTLQTCINLTTRVN